MSGLRPGPIFSLQIIYLGILINKISNSVRSRWCPKLCISSKFISQVDSLILGVTP